jgi:hypothetical protein
MFLRLSLRGAVDRTCRPPGSLMGMRTGSACGMKAHIGGKASKRKFGMPVPRSQREPGRFLLNCSLWRTAWLGTFPPACISSTTVEITSFVITGLVPVIPIRRALSLTQRDGRDRPGHDTRNWLPNAFFKSDVWSWIAQTSCALQRECRNIHFVLFDELFR